MVPIKGLVSTLGRNDPQGHGEQHDNQNHADQPNDQRDQEDYGGAAFRGHGAFMTALP